MPVRDNVLLCSSFCSALSSLAVSLSPCFLVVSLSPCSLVVSLCCSFAHCRRAPWWCHCAAHCALGGVIVLLIALLVVSLCCSLLLGDVVVLLISAVLLGVVIVVLIGGVVVAAWWCRCRRCAAHCPPRSDYRPCPGREASSSPSNSSSQQHQPLRKAVVADKACIRCRCCKFQTKVSSNGQ